MRILRRVLQVVALAGTLLVGVVAIALIVSQTPWFRDWMRRYIVRESKQYLNGELSIGNIGGNLFFGVQVSDLAVDVSGERVVSAKNVEVDYSIFRMVSEGVVLDEIKVVEPTVRLERDSAGWNLSRLVKTRQKEADREGPGAPLSLPSIEVSDARVIIQDHVGTSGYRLPERIEDIDLKASYEYAPVHYSIVVERLSLRSSSPQLALAGLSGKVAVRDDNLYLDKMSIRTAESSLTVDGVIQDYLDTPIVKVTTTGAVSLPEIGRVVPGAEGYGLHPRFDVKASGPAERLDLDLDVRSEAGTVRGRLTTDVKAPGLAARGAVDVERLNLAPLLKDPAQKSEITGRADLDLRVAASPESAPLLDRMSGTFRFAGPTVTAAGYRARHVRVAGSFQESRINIDGRALAYGGTATARGFIVPPSAGRRLVFDLRGRADDVDLRGLPPSIGAPRLATSLSAAEYHVTSRGGTIAGSVALDQSTIEGATVADGTTAEFEVGPARITYSARGNVSALNLPRMGKALNITALEKPAYDGQINGDFEVSGSVPRGRRTAKDKTGVAAITVDATGTLRDSTIMGGRLPELGFETRLVNGGLALRTTGRFEDFNPATLANRKELDGNVTGTLNVTAEIADLTAAITPETITAAGTVTLEQSDIGGLPIDTATVDGKYVAQVADLTTLQVSGRDLRVDASGRVALDRTSESGLKYHIDATDLAALARLAGQESVVGAATLDGTVTGNAASLRTTGTLNGSKVGHGDNQALDLNSTYTVTVPDLTFQQARVEADASATFVKAGALQINAITAKTGYAGDRLSFTTNIKEEQRELDASGEVILHTDHQEVHLPHLAVRTRGVEWRTAPGSEATIKYAQQRVELENVRLVSGDQSLDVSGALALKGETPSGDLKIQAKNVDLQQLETLMLMDRGLGGRLSADATVSGTAEAPVVDGHVEIANGSFRNYRFQSLTADVDYGATRIGLDATLQQSATEAFTAKGTMPVSLFKPSPGGHVAESEADRIDLQIKSTAINLGFVQGFTDQVTNVTGTVEADIHVAGSGQDPHVTGYVDIKGGAFGVPAGGVSYTGLNTRIELEPDRVRLQQFAILDEEGQSLNVSGELATHAREIGAVNIHLRSDNFELIDNELGDVGVHTDLSITGELRRPVVRGNVRLQAARLEVDRILQLFYNPYSIEELPPVVSAERAAEGTGSAEEATASALRRAETTAAVPGTKEEAEAGTAPPPGGAFRPVALDIRLEIPDNLVLRGNRLRPGGPTAASLGNINLTVGGDLQVVKPAGGEMLLLGTIRTIRGAYEFQGRRFDLQRDGTLRFMGEPQPNPALDITAKRVIPNTGVEATVRILGTAKAPQLSLTSNPPLEESDILALIVFNRPVNELGSGERASLASTAGGIATGFLAAPLGESIGRALDLDLFEISTTTEEGELGAVFTLGQQVGDRAFFSLRQQFGERSITEFLLEYSLSSFLRARATAAPETSGSANRIGQRRIERAGIDLIFFFSY
jgi:autotransporter translocation and assembly factor TamB